jgi:hypothetical protein
MKKVRLGGDDRSIRKTSFISLVNGRARQLNAVKTSRLRGHFLAQSAPNRNSTEQSSGSFTTETGQPGLFLETIIEYCFDAKKLSNCEHSARNSSNLELWALSPCEHRPVL